VCQQDPRPQRATLIAEITHFSHTGDASRIGTVSCTASKYYSPSNQPVGRRANQLKHSRKRTSTTLHNYITVIIGGDVVWETAKRDEGGQSRQKENNSRARNVVVTLKDVAVNKKQNKIDVVERVPWHYQRKKTKRYRGIRKTL
jgi:hypothetical protein